MVRENRIKAEYFVIGSGTSTTNQYSDSELNGQLLAITTGSVNTGSIWVSESGTGVEFLSTSGGAFPPYWFPRFSSCGTDGIEDTGSSFETYPFVGTKLSLAGSGFEGATNLVVRYI